MSLNSVALCGRLTDAGVKLTYRASGHPEATWTLILEEPSKDGQQMFTLFVPVVVYGAKAEALAETLEPGDLVTVQGKLGWRAPPATRRTRSPTGKMVVLAWQVERLAGSPAPVAVRSVRPRAFDGQTASQDCSLLRGIQPTVLDARHLTEGWSQQRYVTCHSVC